MNAEQNKLTNELQIKYGRTNKHVWRNGSGQLVKESMWQAALKAGFSLSADTAEFWTERYQGQTILTSRAGEPCIWINMYDQPGVSTIYIQTADPVPGVHCGSVNVVTGWLFKHPCGAELRIISEKNSDDPALIWGELTFPV